MNTKRFKKKLQGAFLPVIAKLQPAAAVVERVATLAVRIQKPTLMSTIGLVSTGLNAAAGYLTQSDNPGWSIQMFVSRQQVVEAVRAAGATVLNTSTDS